MIAAQRQTGGYAKYPQKIHGAISDDKFRHRGKKSIFAGRNFYNGKQALQYNPSVVSREEKNTGGVFDARREAGRSSAIAVKGEPRG
jgi:hypothetical protein